MTKKEKQELSEMDICDLFITPAMKSSGWDQLTQIRREVTLAPGPVIVRGNIWFNAWFALFTRIFST